MTLLIEGGQVLLETGLAGCDLVLEGGVIARVGAGAADRRLDARGLLVLPGIVDVHGDAFERQVQPRPGVAFPLDLALRDTEAQLLANGITTAFHAITLSWEPGLRSAESWRGLVDGMAAVRAERDGTGEAGCDMRAHMRWEAHNLDALEMALDDVAAGRVAMLSFNDHTPGIHRRAQVAETAAPYLKRAGVGLEAFQALAARAMAHGPAVPAAMARLAGAAQAAGVPMASHDDATLAARAAFRALGAAICEFPMAEEVGVDARAAGEAVVMGCPNVVRGGSHLGWASAGGMAERGLCSVLCSDYYYPAMAQAGLLLGRGTLGLAAAWALVSRNPALAGGLGDRGVIAEGKRADLVLLTEDGAVVATVAQGQVAHLGAGGWGRLDIGGRGG